MNIKLTVSILFFTLPIILQAQQTFYHNVIWGRLALSDTITKKFKWDLFIQYRRQNDKPGSIDVFQAPQFTSYWFWLTYSPKKNLKVSVSPFGYFKSWLLIGNPEDGEQAPTREWRWCIRLDNEQKFSKLVYTNRYSLEYRLRNFNNDKGFQPNWRVRYQAKLEKNLPAISQKLSLVVWDEIFIQFGKSVRGNPNIFDQNRLYAGIAYTFSPNIKFNLGYIYQIQQRNSGKVFDQANVLWGVITFENLFSQFIHKKSVINN